MSKREYIEDGVKWIPFAVEFDTQEGKFGFDLYAVDLVHAMERLEELKATARVIGESVGEYDIDDFSGDDT